MKKYVTKDYSNKIIAIDVERETDESVWINGRRNAKITSWARYHNTFDDAKTYLIEKKERVITRAKEEIHQAESAIGTLRKMTESA
jgi:hypothetical protein